MDKNLEQGMTIEQILVAYPTLAHTFIQLKLDCVGCHLARFCTLIDVAESYDMPLEALMTDLYKVVQNPMH